MLCLSLEIDKFIGKAERQVEFQSYLFLLQILNLCSWIKIVGRHQYFIWTYPQLEKYDYEPRSVAWSTALFSEFIFATLNKNKTSANYSH